MPIRWSRIHVALGATPQELTYAMVRQIVEQGVAEAEDLDWKSALPVDVEKKRWEFAKDVAAMANSRGGLIIYGVEEKDEHAVQRLGVTNDERARQRLRALAATRIRPQIAGLEIVALDGEAGEPGLLVVSVPASADAPHIIGEKNEMGVPFRDGSDTRWMSEHQLERAYNDRRDRKLRDEDALNALLADVVDQIEVSAGVWLILAARPSSPIPGVLPASTRADVGPTIADAHAVSLEVAPIADGREALLDLLSTTEVTNPRIGLRRWIVHTNKGVRDAPRTTWIHIELHHDGSVTMAINVRDVEALDKQVPAGGAELARIDIVESVVIDAVALATTHARRLGSDARIALKVAVVLHNDTNGLVITRKHRFEGLGVVPGSRPLPGLKPITAEVSADADAAGLRAIAVQIGEDILHQFAISEPHVLRS